MFYRIILTVAMLAFYSTSWADVEMKNASDMSTIISVISLLIAAGTFFLTQLRPPDITSYLGPTIDFGYRANDGGLSISIPVTFTNHGSRTGIVPRSAVILWRKDWLEERYFMQWDSFVREDFETGRWVTDERAHALAVPGKSIVAKKIAYGWTNPTEPVILSNATYCLAFLYWTNEKRPYHEIHEIPIGADKVAILNAPVDSTHNRAVSILLDEKYKLNEILNKSAYEYRLDGK